MEIIMKAIERENTYNIKYKNEKEIEASINWELTVVARATTLKKCSEEITLT
jgi:hypothetical protein